MDGKSRIYFGQLAGQAQVRDSAAPHEDPEGSSEEEVAESLEFSADILAAKERQNHLLDQLEQRKRARSIAVPTDDNKVKATLRELGHPIILFAEQAPERRERLREVLAQLGPEGVELAQQAKKKVKQEVQQEDQMFYTEGTAKLKACRRALATYSLQRARIRISDAKERAANVSFDEDFKSHSEKVTKLRTFENLSSQVGDRRCISYCEFSPDTSLIATSSWTGLCKLWKTSTCGELGTFKGHEERVNSISFHPHSCASLPKDAANLLTASADGTAKLWSLESHSCLATLTGHTLRVNRAKFHPSGDYIATTSHDLTWRLWDAETQTCLLEQEGHSRAPYGLAFHVDGSLVATGGLDAIGRMWDLRTGKSIFVLKGHAKQVLAIDFAPNGYHLATCGGDNSARIWDMRKKKAIYTIPAHTKALSDVKFQPKGGNFIITSSFDGAVRIWSARDFSPIATMAGHEGRVTCVDVSKDSDDPKYVLTSSSDRTWKLWSPALL